MLPSTINCQWIFPASGKIPRPTTNFIVTHNFADHHARRYTAKICFVKFCFFHSSIQVARLSLPPMVEHTHRGTNGKKFMSASYAGPDLRGHVSCYAWNCEVIYYSFKLIHHANQHTVAIGYTLSQGEVVPYTKYLVPCSCLNLWTTLNFWRDYKWKQK